jgi:ketosteroid isomerase-like protein
MTRRTSLVLLIVAIVFLTTKVAAQSPDDRAADREAIRAHIDSIFQAFINKDNDALRATHAQNWLGYLEGSDSMLKGIQGYMDWSNQDPKSPYGLKSYKFREFDMIFKGDAAFVCFIADTEVSLPNGVIQRALRISDFYTKQNGKWIQSGSYTAVNPDSMQAQVESQMSSLRHLPEDLNKKLLDAREAVWRAYFAGDRATLEKLIPEETITIEAGEDNWSNRKTILEGSTEFAKGGNKLIKLEFPKTEIQVYGLTAIVYSTYLYELEVGGSRVSRSGRVTEVFVLRNGQWVNPGWHMDSGK